MRQAPGVGAGRRHAPARGEAGKSPRKNSAFPAAWRWSRAVRTSAPGRPSPLLALPSVQGKPLHTLPFRGQESLCLSWSKAAGGRKPSGFIRDVGFEMRQVGQGRVQETKGGLSLVTQCGKCRVAGNHCLQPVS